MKLKRLFFVLSIVLTACGAVGAPDVPFIAAATPVAATLAPAVCQYLATQESQCSPAATTPAPITPTPNPTVTPSTAPTVVPTVTATPDDSCTFTQDFFVRVMPFAVGSNNWNIYIADFPPVEKGLIPYGYPATLFFQYFLNMKSFLTDTMYVNLENTGNPNWLQEMININGPEWHYLVSGSDGTFFNDGSKLGDDTFPGNVLRIIDRTFKKGQCWDRVDAIPYKDNNPIDLTTVPPWQLGHQTNQHFDHPGVVYQNGIEDVPILFQQKESLDVVSAQYQGDWVPDDEVEAFPILPMNIVLTSDVNVRAACNETSAVTDQIVSGTQLTLTDYYPTQDRTFGTIVNPNDGKSGCISLFY